MCVKELRQLKITILMQKTGNLGILKNIKQKFLKGQELLLEIVEGI